MKLSVLSRILIGLSLPFIIGLGLYALAGFNNRPAAVPNTPQEAAELFVLNLASHQYEGAANSLTSHLSGEVTVHDLEILAATIDAHQMGIRNVSGSELQTQDGKLSVRVAVLFNSGLERNLDLPVVDEDGAWKVASIDPLWSMILNHPEVELLNG